MFIACEKERSQTNQPKAQLNKDISTLKGNFTEEIQSDEVPQITFIELGSVNCIPCKKMQPVMEAIEKKYGEQISVIFYDVWTEEGRPYAQMYDIRLIPTQIFTDQEGVELLRHEGFFPEQEIDKFLQAQGLKPLKKQS